MPVLALLLILVVGYFVVSRMNELFCLSYRDGKALLVRGRIPNTLHQDVVDVLTRAGVDQATVRGVKAEGYARLVCRGVDDGVAQRLRNVFGTHPISVMRKAPRGDRNIGQLLGIAWLAWWLSSF